MRLRRYMSIKKTSRAWLDEHYYGLGAGVSKIQMLRNTTRESAQRMIARGKRLIVVKRKTSP